jgi:uncharacterized membrane protein SirB2
MEWVALSEACFVGYICVRGFGIQMRKFHVMSIEVSEWMGGYLPYIIYYISLGFETLSSI